MATTLTVATAARMPGPPELLPGRPDAIIDLQTEAGASLVGAAWRYADARCARSTSSAWGRISARPARRR